MKTFRKYVVNVNHSYSFIFFFANIAEVIESNKIYEPQEAQLKI